MSRKHVSSRTRCGRVRVKGWCAFAPLGEASPFIDAFHVPTVGISLANFDDNQHTDNENLRLGNLWNGIFTFAAIMTK